MPEPLFQNVFILRKPGVAIFADIIKIVTMFIENFIKDLEQLKALETIYQNSIYICISYRNLIQQSFLISGEKVLISTELKRCIT